METIQIEILNPKAKNIIMDLADLNLISITKDSNIPYDELEEALTSEELLKNLKPRIKKLFEK